LDKKDGNIVFKCNFCDGGKSEQQIGFNGICSDETISYNIKEHRGQCMDSPCYCYHNKKISRKELDASCENARGVCYESRMLSDWKASAGFYKKGEKRDTPKAIREAKVDSLCVLTTLIPNGPVKTPEEDRCIFAVFFVDNLCEGDEKQAGYVCTKSQYKIKLSLQQAQRLRFWDYYVNIDSERPEIPKWGSSLHRYLENQQAAQILRDIADKVETPDKKLALDFLKHFCKVKDIDASNLGAPRGALKM